MNPESLRKLVRGVGGSSLGLSALFVIIALLHSSHTGQWFLYISVASSVWYYWIVYRAYLTDRWTVHWHFNAVHGAMISLAVTVGLLIAFLMTEEMISHSIGWVSVLALSLVATHQVYRGHSAALRRWRTRTDVMEITRMSAVGQQGFARRYDFGFFALVALAGSLLGRLAGESTEVLLAATLFVLGMPYVIGLVMGSRAQLRRLLPMDEPYPRSTVTPHRM